MHSVISERNPFFIVLLPKTMVVLTRLDQMTFKRQNLADVFVVSVRRYNFIPEGDGVY